MITSLLIANRGEIACRIMRTARAMGIRTVAVYSDADAKALHVREADATIHIGSSEAKESYLKGEKIIAAAKESGAEAIHPGYGFLSENADFAQAVIDAGLIWVGPKPESIRAMGLKDAAKKLMAESGVPVTPGYLGENQSPERLKAEADAIGYPVLIKAVAGGGGKGMRRVDAAADFADALTSCKREAASSFGDDRVLIEKYILSPRHIEVQVFGDTHGNIVHLFERDCSLQRRHQKVIEEAPAPGMDEATRAEICAAAVRAAQAVDYVGAGTIEFIADASEGLRADRIWFMEMNTRLQVEHPVTEEITGVDLVEWQLRVASGEKLPKAQEALSINGHAIEARLYAEDVAHEFLPSTGRLDSFMLGSAELHFPANKLSFRIETGVEQGSEISPFYDPMIAKLVSFAPTRDAAAAVLARACDATRTWPVRNNAGLLSSLLRHPEFLEGTIDTGFIAREVDAIIAKGQSTEGILPAAAAQLFRRAGGSLSAVYSDEFPARPGEVWSDIIGFRLNSPVRSTMWLRVDGELKEAEIGTMDAGNHFGGSSVCGLEENDGILIVDRGWPHVFELDRADGGASAAAHSGAILAPMPGRILAVQVAEGEAVTKGQKLLTLEAMKMEHTLTAPFDGTVSRLAATEGDQVQLEAVLAEIEPSGEGDA